MINVPQYLKSVRRLGNLTQAQLADLIADKRSNIAKYETSTAMPLVKFLKVQELEKELHQKIGGQPKQ